MKDIYGKVRAVTGILAKIQTASIEFEVKTGKPPTRLYLGEEELGALKAMANSGFGCGYQLSGSPQCMGMEIFEVVAPTHIAVM